jgi:hypothetical protein
MLSYPRPRQTDHQAENAIGVLEMQLAPGAQRSNFFVDLATRQ